MNGLLQWLEALIHAIPSFFLSPFPYVMLGIIALQWQRQIDLERKLFSARLHTVAEGILHSVFYGLLGGLLVSILILGSGVVFSTVPLLYLWGIAFVLMLFHVRYLCFAYSGAILGGAVLVARWFPQGADIVWLSEVWGQLNSISLPSLFAFVALLHLIEALLIFLAGSKRGTPIYLEGKRGKLVGGYQLQHFWLVPVFVLVEGGQATLPVLYQGWPFFTTSSTAVYSLLLVPAVLVFSEQVTSSRPEQKAKFMAQGLAAYSLLLLGMAVATQYAPSLSVLTLLVAIGGHEALAVYSRWKEGKHPPYYVHPRDGVKILAVIPYSPAEKMGLRAGEVIVKVNGMAVKERKELYQALTCNLAFCKLEVINLEGHLKFAKSSLYETDHHQLGVILAPDDEIPYYMAQKRQNLLQLLRQRLIRKNKNHQELNQDQSKAL